MTAIACEQVCREISNYLDGDVGPDLRNDMDDHFKQCRLCSAILDGTGMSCNS